MKRIANRLALAGLFFAVACSDSDGPVNLIALTYTLQGVVADAVTGARLGGDLKLYVVQGAEIRGPSRLITNTGDPLAGEYAFVGIPLNTNSGNAVFKVVAIRSGYQRFESEINYSVTSIEASGANVFLDNVYNRIGNIFLFPTGVTAPDYNITTTYNGAPVPGATVQLDPISASNAGAFATGGTGDTLAANNGYVTSLQATTDANGLAKFTGALLAVGAAYKVQVLPVAFKQPISGATIQLALYNPTAGPGSAPFIAGLGNIDQHIALSALPPSPAGVPLYVTSATNAVTGSLQANGALVVTFSVPVSGQSIAGGFTAALNPGTKADGTAGAGVLNATNPVIGSLSADGVTLTLTANYTGGGGVAPAGNERGLAITYVEGPPPGAAAGVTFPLIEAKDYPAVPFDLFTASGGGVTQLRTASGTFVSGRVQIVAP